ncbi:hypothetical protein BLNAU_18592 [Blattamonas nauphoetae]|uniref:Uncharacterized protein n=1 Tax=Blattamonas nauphoetae TaxID=2049346 RepID=A0ABQ9X3Z0_9EUKA|nr:hypothetical protein BLNAU_18592 [Blattamonas nauphoetae]
MVSLTYLLFHIITIVLTHATQEGHHQSLNALLDEFSRTSYQQNSNTIEVIRLPKGIFSSHDSSVNSVMLNIEGINTQIQFSKPSSTDRNNSSNNPECHGSNTPTLSTLFKIHNSTVCMACLSLMCEDSEARVATVSSSSLTVSNSEIHSNGANSPFVMLGGVFDGQPQYSGSSLHVSKCRHISSSLVSLAPLTEISRKSQQYFHNGEPLITYQEIQVGKEMTVAASELSIGDSCLTFGTGPLIGFGSRKHSTERGGEQAVLPRKVSTLLSKSQIVNTTSNPSALIDDEAERMELTQRVTSSRVHLSTNHLYGTACVDVNANVMGSLLSLNSSFSSCLTNTPTHLSQHYTTHQGPTEPAVFVKLCTFKDCSSTEGYPALHVQKTGSLIVEECSFKTCRGAPQYSSGGAIFFQSLTGVPFIAMSSSFVGCSADSGGSLRLYCSSQVLINCIFIDSQSMTHGGCICSDIWDAASTSSSITNCHFENCRTTDPDPEHISCGGAL